MAAALEFYGRHRCCPDASDERAVARRLYARSLALLHAKKGARKCPLWRCLNHRNVARSIVRFISVNSLVPMTVVLTHGPTSEHGDADATARQLLASDSDEVWLTAPLRAGDVASFTCEVKRRLLHSNSRRSSSIAQLAAFSIASVRPSPSFAYEVKVDEVLWGGGRLPRLGRCLVPWSMYGQYRFTFGFEDPAAYEAQRVEVVPTNCSTFKVSVRHNCTGVAYFSSSNCCGVALFRAEGSVVAKEDAKHSSRKITATT